MMMSRNSVTSYFCKSLKGSYPIHSHRYKSGSNFTKVIELHKTKISEGRIRPKGSIQVVKGKKEGVTSCRPHPSKRRAAPTTCACREFGPSLCPVTQHVAALLMPKNWQWVQRQPEKMGQSHGKPQWISGPWILLQCQLMSVSPRPRYRAALSQFASTGCWHTGCCGYPRDTVSFWHLSYLTDKHSCPQQRGIGCF